MKYTIFIISLIALLSTSTLYSAEAKKVAQKVQTMDDYQFYQKSGHRSPEWDEFVEPAFQSFDGGNLSTAYVFLRRAYDRGCRDGLLLYRLGLYLETRGKYKEAADLTAQAAAKIPKQYPNHPLSKGIHEHAGRILYQTEQYDLALPELKKALDFKPDNFMALFMTGQILRIQKRYDESRQVFEKAISAAPPAGTTPNPRLQLARELMIVTFELKDFDAALAYADVVLSVAPSDQLALSYKNRIGIEKQKAREREAIERIVK